MRCPLHGATFLTKQLEMLRSIVSIQTQLSPVQLDPIQFYHIITKNDRRD